MPYGYRVAAIDVYTGNLIFHMEFANHRDIFVSSPTVTADGTALFVHSASGTLWRLNVTVTYPNVTMRVAWYW